MAREYRIVAKIKNNRLWSAITQRWPDVQTQADAARRLDVSPQELGRIINMQIWPYTEPREGRRGGWWPIAHKIADALYADPEFLFDGALYGQPPKRIDLEIDREALERRGLIHAQDTPLMLMERAEENAELYNVLATLTPREEKVLRLRFGLNDGHERTLADVGQDFDLGVERIRQIEARALRKLRHPVRADRIAPGANLLPSRRKVPRRAP